MAFCGPVSNSASGRPTTTGNTTNGPVVNASNRGQPNAARLLESLYHINNYPTSDAIEMIAQRIRTDYDTVVRWFELRRRQDQDQQQQQFSHSTNSHHSESHHTNRHPTYRSFNRNVDDSALEQYDYSYEEENDLDTSQQYMNNSGTNSKVSSNQQQYINAATGLANALTSNQSNQLTAALASDPSKLLENLQQLLMMCQHHQPQNQQQQQQQQPQFNNSTSSRTHRRNPANVGNDPRQVLSKYPTNGSSYQIMQHNTHNSLSSYSPSSSPSEDDQSMATPGFASKLKEKLASVKKPNNRVFSFSDQQRQILEQLFEANNYLKPGECRQLSDLIQVPSRNIKIWYKNRRSKKRALAKQAPDGAAEPEEDFEQEDMAD